LSVEIPGRGIRDDDRRIRATLSGRRLQENTVAQFARTQLGFRRYNFIEWYRSGRCMVASSEQNDFSASCMKKIYRDVLFWHKEEQWAPVAMTNVMVRAG
jgi:hypothetical protein